jgi:CcmD family protein
MSDWGYILAGYLAVFGGVGAYVVRLVLRGRSLSRRLPPEDRRWT